MADWRLSCVPPSIHQWFTSHHNSGIGRENSSNAMAMERPIRAQSGRPSAVAAGLSHHQDNRAAASENEEASDHDDRATSQD
mmetsp:Transcript_8874/g.19922  ORF Transcript_8874/g.19922 Transcript_8874/m.19922 type:complete len:82 (+) Transcript_8874:1433-1678(+)